MDILLNYKLFEIINNLEDDIDELNSKIKIQEKIYFLVLFKDIVKAFRVMCFRNEMKILESRFYKFNLFK